MPVPANANERREDRPSLDTSRLEMAERRRLAGPGLRTFVAIADRWGLSEPERLRVLGYPPRSTYYAWLKSAQRQAALTLSVDTLMRISAVLGIYKAQRILFETEDEGLAWLRGPHAATVFGDRPPLDLATCGTQDGLLTVRRFLDAARGGIYMEPNSADHGFKPYEDSDIVMR